MTSPFSSSIRGRRRIYRTRTYIPYNRSGTVLLLIPYEVSWDARRTLFSTPHSHKPTKPSGYAKEPTFSDYIYYNYYLTSTPLLAAIVKKQLEKNVILKEILRYYVYLASKIGNRNSSYREQRMMLVLQPYC